MEIMYDVSFAATMFLGSAIMILTAFHLYDKALDKILGLLKVKKVIINWFYHKGKCKECRENDVDTPKLKH